MPASADPFPPVDYSALWQWLGVAAVVAVLAWYVALWWWTRPRPERPATPLSLPDLRHEYLDRIDELERESSAGLLTSRELHQRLSLLVREFVHDRTRQRTHTMTLSELRASGPDRLSELIELYYPVEFSPAEHGDAVLAVSRAREVVGTWS